MIKSRKELIDAYLNFFRSKKHAIISSASLIPENDPTVLFTTAGMHPLVPFLLGQPHPLGKRVANVQKCIRTGDINDVGDDTHLTFFEMLGNWSLGDYFKKQAIEWSFEFLTKILKIPLDKLAVSVFAGDKDAPKDNEAAELWQNLGIPKERIAFLPKSENWWGPAGKTGPCGPDTEMFFYKSKKAPKKFEPEDKNWVEIWNDVLMQYNKDENGNYNLAKQKNVDTGMGIERTLASLQTKESVYETECFMPIIKEIEKISKKKYGKGKETRSIRIIADHIKAAVFILGDDKHIKPGNVEQGYVLRRLIRRAIRYGKELGIKNNFTAKIAQKAIKIYERDYQELKRNKNFILTELDEEENRFMKTLESGIREFEKIKSKSGKIISGKDAFLLYQSYGFPLEMTKELAEENKIKINEKEYEEEFKKHQELSRTASEGRFKSGLADVSEQTTKLHTATHLLQAALKKALGNHVQQKGSNITPERLRFDFSHGEKMTQEQIKETEKLVNDWIKKHLEVKKEILSPEEAKKHGATGLFDAKYGEKVSVYTIQSGKDVISKEICAGPHIANTKQLGKFKILKEESVAAGVRRIKAILV